MVISAMRANTAPNCLKLHRYFEIIDDNNNMAEHLDSHELEIDLDPMRSPREECLAAAAGFAQGGPKEWKIALWLQDLGELRTLKLSQPTHKGLLVDIVGILLHINMPKLRTVSFSNLFTSNRVLEEFVRHHGKHMETLTICRPYWPSYKPPKSRESLEAVCAAYSVNLTFSGIKSSD